MNKKKHITSSEQKTLFGKRNYQFMLLGLLFIIIGFVLMSGGGSDNPNEWNEAIYNFRRIRLAPMLILLGLVIEIYAILLNPKK